MIAHVYRQSRRVGGKRVLSKVWRGRYSLGRGQPVRDISLDTQDKAVAEKRLRDRLAQAQKEAEGMIAPVSITEAQREPLISLLADYLVYLRGRELAEGHVKESVARIERIVTETGWRVLADVRPDGFLRWRSGLRCGAKTKKEYQTSLNAFLNWLVKIEKLERSPLAHVEQVDTRGKETRPYRAFTEDELRRLFATAGERVLAYQTLLYTGQRRSEVASLVWGDLHLKEAQPFALFRAATMKDAKKRAVPLHPALSRLLRVLLNPACSQSDLVFPDFPTWEALQVDLARAGIERKDGLGRSVHFHSFRKTWQTMGVRAGINQRAAQAVLGHSDANLTARAYTDVPALGLASEVAKLPWVSSQPASQIPQKRRDFQTLLVELVEAAKSVISEGKPALEPAFAGGAGWLPDMDSNHD